MKVATVTLVSVLNTGLGLTSGFSKYNLGNKIRNYYFPSSPVNSKGNPVYLDLSMLF